MKIKLITLLFVLFTSGCSKYWFQEGVTFDQCKQDRTDCRNALSERSDLKSAWSNYEARFMAECMEDQGYRLVGQNELPLDVKRETPDLWQSVGVAGTLVDK